MFHFCRLYEKDQLIYELLTKRFTNSGSLIVFRFFYGFWDCTYKKLGQTREQKGGGLLKENLSFVDRYFNIIKVHSNGFVTVDDQPTCHEIIKIEKPCKNKNSSKPRFNQPKLKKFKKVYFLQIKKTSKSCKNNFSFILHYQTSDVLVWKNTETDEELVWRNLESLLIGFYKYKTTSKKTRICEITRDRIILKDNVSTSLMFFHDKIYSTRRVNGSSSSVISVNTEKSMAQKRIQKRIRSSGSVNALVPASNFDFYTESDFCSCKFSVDNDNGGAVNPYYCEEEKEVNNRLKLKWRLRYINYARSVFYWQNVNDSLLYAWQQYQPLYKLFYVSRVVGIGTTEGIELCQSICRFAHVKNLKNNITGQLTYHPDFFQVQQHLEGKIDAIKSLWFDNILKDKRHDHIRLITIAPISCRKFPGWGMRYHEIWESKAVCE